MLAKLVIVLFIIAILFSLGSALYYLLHERQNPERMVKALTLRIGLSFVLFILLMVGAATGLLKPNHVVLFEKNQAVAS